MKSLIGCVGWVCLWVGGMLSAQSPHFDQHQQFHLPAAATEADYDAAYAISYQPPATSDPELFMRRTVYGFHPGWQGTAYETYDASLLPVVAYYGYIVDPATGGYEELYFWKTTPLVDRIKKAGGEVELVVATGTAAANRQLLARPNSVATLTDSLMALLRLRNANGFCLDFEALPPDQSEAFADFVQQLSDTLRTYRRRPRLTITLPATDPGGAYDLSRLRDLATQFVLKPYAHPATAAGPLDPLNASGDHPGIAGALGHWIDRGVPREMILLGLPTYGQLPRANGSEAIPYGHFRRSYSWRAAWDSTAVSPVYREADREVWLHDARSLSRRMDLIYDRNLGGIALWALGYDHGFSEIHDLVAEKMTRREASSLGVETDSLPPGWIGEDGGATKLRNEYNWMWMMGGCVGLLLILFLLKRFWK